MVCKFQVKVFLLKIVMFQFQNSFVSTMKSFEEDIIQSDKSLGFILNDFLDKKKSDNQKDPKCNCGFMSDLNMFDLQEKSKAISLSRRTNIKRRKTKGARILGGYLPRGPRPWMAFIDMTDYSGAGSIISRKYVLTAAHVICNIPEFCESNVVTAKSTPGLDWIKVITGTKDPFAESNQMQVHFVDTLYIHPDFNNTSNDIAIIKIDGQFKFNKFVRPICLWDLNTSVFQQGVVSGWGVTNIDGRGCLTRQVEPNPFSICKNNFTFNGTTYEGKCITTANIPIGDKLCELFGKKYPFGVDIVHIKKGDKLVRCYPPKSGDYGWCPITQHINEVDDDNEDSYGFCSEDCFKDDAGRKFFEVVLDIIDPVVCGDFLENFDSLDYEKERDLCAAKEVLGNLTTVIFMRSSGGLKKYESGQRLVKFYGGKDACRGDSGGPMYVFKKEKTEEGRTHFRAIIIGIVSRGKLCALRNKPGLLTKISYYLPWILNITQDYTC